MANMCSYFLFNSVFLFPYYSDIKERETESQLLSVENVGVRGTRRDFSLSHREQGRFVYKVMLSPLFSGLLRAFDL